MSGITFSGLASGLDTGAIIDQLVKLERIPAQKLTERKNDTNAHIGIVNDLVTKLKALKEKADDFKTVSDIRTFKAESSDESRIGVTSSGSALPGVYNIRVNQLARNETTVSNAFATQDAGVVGTGSVTIAVGSGDAVQIDYDASHSLGDIATMINDSVEGVAASVVYDGTNYQLMVTSTETGVDNAISFSESGSALGLADPANEKVSALNAMISLNGIDIERATNTMSDVLSGVTLKLETETGVGDPDTVVSVARDPEGMREKLEALVDSYNSVVGVLNAQLSYNGVERGTNTLFGDSTLQGLQRTLQGKVTSAFSHNGGTTSLGALGIELDNTGKLSINDSKFDEALAKDPTAIEDLLAGENSDGLAYIFGDLVDSYTRAGDGFLTGKKKALEDRIKGFDQQIERIELRASSLGERLQKQFTALETAMSELQGQQRYLASIL